MRAVFVLWDGKLFGGAETATIALCGALRRKGVEASVVFVGTAGVYEEALRDERVPWSSVGYCTGRSALISPREFLRVVAMDGAEIVVIPGANFLAAALRIAGYRGRLVAVEHGGILQPHMRTSLRRVVDRVDRAIATPLLDAQVAVSDFLLSSLVAGTHARHVVRIHNGVDVSRFASAAASRASRRDHDSAIVIGAAGKLMRGKGFEDIIDAAKKLDRGLAWRLEIAGDGPLRPDLEARVVDAGISDRVGFVGWVEDVAVFWAGCDLAVAASNECIESFGMVVVEALASGIPVVVSRSGGLPEVLGDTGAGAVFDPGDITALALVLESFLSDEKLRDAATVASLPRAESFSIETAASGYADLFMSLMDRSDS